MKMASTWVRLTFLALFFATATFALTPDPTSDLSSENDNDENYSDWAWSSEEDGECDEESFWHIRGRRCVPYICPKGNSQRNFDTGECLYSSAGELLDGTGVKGQTPGNELLIGRAPVEMPVRWWSDQPKGLAKMTERSKFDKVNGGGRRSVIRDAAWVRRMIMKQEQMKKNIKI